MRRGGGQLPNIMSLRPGLGDVPAIRAIIEQLGGGRLEGGESMTKAIFPTPFPLPDGGATHWVRPEGHVDGYTNQWDFNPGVGVTLYLDPVAERGGAFSVWPAQHKRVREFLEAHPEEIDGRQRSWQMFCEAEPEWQGASELQFVGEAGSCMFWHAMLPHGASLNASARPRLATIARWRFPLPEVPPTIEMVSRS